MRADAEGSGYKIQAEWKADWEIEEYTGPFQAELRLDGKAEQTYEAGSHTSFAFTLTVPKKLSGYSLVIKGKAEDGSYEESNEADLLLHTFSEVKGRFDGEVLHLSWKEDEDISYGQILLEDESVTKTGFGRCSAHIQVHTELLEENKASSIRMIPILDSVSRGPEYLTSFYFQKGRITALEDAADKDGSIILKTTLSHPIKDSQGLQAKLILMSGTEQLASAFAFPPSSGDIWEFQIKKEGWLTCSTIKMLQMNLALCSAQVDGPGNEPADFIPLTEVSRITCLSNAKQAKLSWEWMGCCRPTHFEIQAGTQSFRTADTEFTFDFSENYDLEASVRPCYGSFTGRPSEKKILFEPGIFTAGGEIGTVGAGAASPEGDADYTLLFRQELFLARPQNDISSDGFCLHKSEEGKTEYKLTADRPKDGYEEKYRAFLKLLSDNKITAEGMFLLTDSLARLMPISFDKLLYYACDFDGDGRSVGLRPGMVLKVETEHYQPPYPDTKQYLPGYIASGQFDYEIGSRGSKELWKTCFHPMLEGMKLKIRTYGKEKGALEYQNGSGGILDLTADAASHQAFYRLEYPVQMADSQEVGSSYGPANACLYGYDKYTELTADMNHSKMTGTGQKLPAFYFRGRAAVTVCIHVWINGEEHETALGTTLRQLMQRMGVHSFENTDFRMERSTGAARLMRGSEVISRNYLPLHPDLGDDSRGYEQLPLLNGDRIWIGRDGYAGV